MPAIASAASAAALKAVSGAAVATAASAAHAVYPGWFEPGSLSFEWLKALPAWIVPAFFSYLAWTVTAGQHRTAKAKLNLDLFERRYAAYNLLWRFLSCHIAGRDQLPNMYAELQNGAPEFRFLFGPEVYAYVREALTNSTAQDFALSRLRQVYENQAGERQQAISENMRLTLWFEAQANGLPERFAPYLDFSSWTASTRP